MNIRNIIIGIVVLLVLGGVFVAMGGGTTLGIVAKPTPTPISALSELDYLVTASGTFLPAKRASLSFTIQGQVIQVVVKVGDTVKRGDVLIRLDSGELEAAVAQAKAAVALAEANLAQLKAGASKEDIAAAEATLDTARAQLAKARAGATAEDVAIAQAALVRAEAVLRDAQSAYDKVRGNPDVGMYPQSQALHLATQEYRIAKARYDQVIKGPTAEDVRIAEMGVAAAQANLNRVKQKARPEEIAAAQARLDQAQAALQQAQATVANTILKAPFDGTVVAINIKEGEAVVLGTPAVITLGDLTTLRLETDDLSETNIARVQVGQSANVTFESLQGKTFKGKVTSIAPIATAKSGGTNYTVYVEIPNADPVLRWGMTGRVEIDTKQ